jgi:Uma2 family endonuclease
MAVSRTRITVDDLARLDDQWVEVVEGQLVEIDTDTMGLEHTIIIHNLYDLLKPVVKAHSLGYVHGDGLKYILMADEYGVQSSRTPDLAFIRRGRVPPDFDRTRPFPGAPDLAVEVASPGQTNTELLAKVADYLKAGTEEVWMIYPARAELHQYRRDEDVPRVYRDADSIDAGAFFPDVKFTVRDLLMDDVE